MLAFGGGRGQRFVFVAGDTSVAIVVVAVVDVVVVVVVAICSR